MAQLSVFNFTTLNGFFSGPGGHITWNGHRGGDERDFAIESAGQGSTLLFGRITYDMMIQWWPTEQAIAADPDMAGAMNEAEKIVFSRTLRKAAWNNTRVVRDNLVETVRKIKQDRALTVLGSGQIVTQLAEAGLVDEYQVMINPVAIGKGTPLLKGFKGQLELQLVSTRVFDTGSVLLTYQPL